jgi:hypothetical protein
VTLGVISKDKFCKALHLLGFIENKSRDHIYLEYYHRGKKIIETKVSHGGDKDISKRLLGYILREQIYLTKQEFESVINGEISTEDYRLILTKKGII